MDYKAFIPEDTILHMFLVAYYKVQKPINMACNEETFCVLCFQLICGLVSIR
jgi:hypothetical protein